MPARRPTAVAARVALGCAVGLVVAAGAVVLVDGTPPQPADPAAGVSPAPTGSPAETARGTAPESTSAPSTTAAPSASAGPAPLTVAASSAVVPTAGESFVAAEVPVELSSVCEGAALDVTTATPLYASLQSSAAPLRFLDIAVAVYPTPEDAVRAFERLATDVAACPITRTATPAPTAGQPPAPIIVEGGRRDVMVLEQPAIQWVQVQAVASPATQLRTAVTIAPVQNVVVMVSMDGDSETVGADALAADALARAEALASALAAAAVA